MECGGRYLHIYLRTRKGKFNVIVRTLHLVKYKHLLFIHKTAFKKQLIHDLVALVLSLLISKY